MAVIEPLARISHQLMRRSRRIFCVEQIIYHKVSLRQLVHFVPGWLILSIIDR